MGHRQAGRAGMPSISSHSEAVLYHTESHHISVSSILVVWAVSGAANNKLFDYKCTEYFIYSSESCEDLTNGMFGDRIETSRERYVSREDHADIKYTIHYFHHGS